MKVKDCLDLNLDCRCIIYRCNSCENDIMGTLSGYASYHAGDAELISESDCNFSLEDDIIKYD